MGPQSSSSRTHALPAPPDELITLTGSVDLKGFRDIGERFVADFRDLAGLRPDESVLEVGSGSGRMAAPLLGYLDEHGSYDGFDVVLDAVAWCNQHLAPEHPRFRFHHADLLNRVYNPGGALRADDYAFPFPDESFDFVFLTSVFTHLLPDAVAHYLDEIRRVLRPGGRVLSSWFVLDEWSRPAVTALKAAVPFVPRSEPWWVIDPELDESAVAYDARLVHAYHADAGLPIGPIVYGTWSDRSDGHSFQDIVIGYRVGSTAPHGSRRDAVGKQYDIQPNFRMREFSPARQLALVGGNKRVLELGCGYGYTSRELAARGCHVTGIEIDATAAERAREHCDEVIVGDLDTVDLEAALGDARFEAALCGDVLEHLKDPASLLRQMKQVLSPGGFVVACIPNVAHGSVRLALLQGRFDYRDLGLLDETHLHLFTRDSVESLFRDAGLIIAEVQEAAVGIFDTEIPLRRDDFDAELVEALEADPAALTYQFVVKAVVDDAAGIVEELRRHTVELRDEIDALCRQRDEETARADEVTRWAEHLVAELASSERGREQVERTLAMRAYRSLIRLRRRGT